MTRASALLLLAVLGLVSRVQSTRLFGQTSAHTGTIRGVILDATFGPITGARVAALNQDTSTSRETRSGANGQFYLGSLPAGNYVLICEMSGFQTVKMGPFPVSVGQTVTDTITLQPAGVIEKIEVREQPEAVDTAASTASVALGSERIEEAPGRSRNYLNFVLLAPGVAPSAGSSPQRTMTGVRSPNADSGFAFGGMRGRNNSMNIDGVDNRDETTGGSRVAIGLEMVQEFRVASASVGAELGGAAGGLLNMVTRPGTNLFHGDITFFTQNERFNAKKPEVADGLTPEFRRYQPGTSLNGPIRRDRTFFSTAIEMERESAEEWSGTPLSAAGPINRTLASPAFRNAPVRSVWIGLYGTSSRGIEMAGKLNHQIGERDSLSARYAYSRGRVLGEVQGPDNFADRSAQGSSRTTDHSLVGSWMRVQSPARVNEVRLHYAERAQLLLPSSQGPLFDIPGVVSFGQSVRLNSTRTERHYQLVDNVNLVLGHHRLSTGIDAHWVSLDSALRTRFGGVFVFPTLDDFAAGRPDVWLQAFGSPARQMSTVPIGLWIHDRWDLRPGLLAEFGIRFDRQRMPTGLPSSSNNVAPRVGLAWRPWAKQPLVVRLGAGLFYDRYPLAFLLDALQAKTEQYAVGIDAQRALAAGAGATLASPLPGLPSSRYQASADFPSTYSRKFTFGVERGLGRDSTLSFEASHVRGFHLPRTRNAAGTLPPAYLLEQTARSDYLGGTVSLHRRLSREVAFLATYSAGRTRDDGSDFDEHPLDPLDLRRDWALSRQHQLHRITLSGLFDLPDFDGLPGFLRETLEQLSIAPIYTAGSGRPLNTVATTDLFRTGAYPISARPFGLGRNGRLSRWSTSADLRVMKTFPLMHDRAKLQFGVESFNLFNHSNTVRLSPFFSAGDTRLGTYGASLESQPGRQVQFLTQFEF